MRVLSSTCIAHIARPLQRAMQCEGWQFGISNVTIVFSDSTDIYFARQLVLERLATAREQIPSNIGSPEMGPIATGLGEIYQYEVKAIDGSKYSATDLRTIHDWTFADN